MIYTSYFFSDKLNTSQNLVSIAISNPVYARKKFKNLANYALLKPSRQLVFAYKDGSISEGEYTVEFYKQLAELNPKQIYAELDDSILLCWERPDSFCHRHLVAKWLTENTNMEVLEL